ncbi:MAG: MopE-related protein [Myxococcota bacterium]
MRLSRIAVFVVVSASVACKSEQVLAQREARLVFAPPLVDLGDVAVGAEVIGAFDVDQVDGPDGEIRNVVVTNLVGDAFRYDGEDRIEVPHLSRIQLPIVFAPLEAGWFQASVQVVHDGIDEVALLAIRGHAVAADASLAPLAVDFGRVAPGSLGGSEVVITNRGTVPLHVTDLTFTHPAFSVGGGAPTDVAPGRDAVVPIRFAPTDDLPLVATLQVHTGEVALPVVSLRGNDCTGGLPDAYDVDQDGFTSCAGDCDDATADVHPGAVERVDGIDQDCDGLVDDGTAAFDDDGDGRSEDAGDCNDGAGGVGPDAVEVLGNGIDDDCDGVVDLGTTDLDVDGYDPAIGGDCDDGDPTVHPGAPELEDALDNDCDGTIDEGTPAFDDDGDGITEAAGDCDDARSATHPGAPELADWQDNNCDGGVDEGTVNADDDGDGYSEIGGDCDDADAAASPGLGSCP